MEDLCLFLKPLLLTILFEGIAAYLSGIRTWKQQLLILLVNVITNPLLVYFSLLLMYHLGIEAGSILTYAFLEPLVILAEFLFYRRYLEHDHPFKISLILNIVSIIGGLLCQRII